jgi:hypothetical protein
VSTEYARFGSSGNFGIGDNSPSDKLSVTGNIAATGTVTAADLTLEDTTPRIRLTDTDGTNQWTTISEVSGNTFYISNNDATKGQHIFQQVASGVYTEAMRINTSGNVQMTGDVTAKNFIGSESNPAITSADADGYLGISGDSTVLTGGNIRLFSAAHATNANNILFRNNTTTALYYDSNASEWDFNANDIVTTGTVTATDFAGDGSALTGIAAGAGGGGSDEIFWENGQNVTTNYTVTNGKNAMSAGPITINSGVTVTVGAGETWTVI